MKNQDWVMLFWSFNSYETQSIVCNDEFSGNLDQPFRCCRHAISRYNCLLFFPTLVWSNLRKHNVCIIDVWYWFWYSNLLPCNGGKTTVVLHLWTAFSFKQGSILPDNTCNHYKIIRLILLNTQALHSPSSYQGSDQLSLWNRNP